MNLQDEAILTLIGGPDVVQSIKSAEATDTFNQLPKDCPRDDLILLGFEFGEELDDLFVSVTPPKGWTLKHKESYHSYLYDEQGRERGYMFYKGVFYDRCAYLRLLTRYHSVFDVEPMPPMVNAMRWCRMGKERGYDVVVEVMPENFKPPKARYVKDVFADLYYIDNDFGTIRQHFGENKEATYAFKEVEVYATEPKPYNERLHRYLATDRATGEVMLTGEWIKNSDYSDEARAKEAAIKEFFKANFPEYENPMRYW